MNILVCVKQVPNVEKISIDRETNTLIRENVPGILNPFDGYALETAARIKDTQPNTKIVVLTMGPEQAKTVLKDCLAVAADKAYLLSDPAFGGADTFATSYTLSKAVEVIEETEGRFDLILCGRQAIDGETAQVGAELAEHLDRPQVTCCLDVTTEAETAIVRRETETGTQVIAVQLPCVITVTKAAWELRYPTIRQKLAANRAEIPVIQCGDLKELDHSCIGLRGSPTRVVKTFVVPQRGKCTMIQASSGADAAKALYYRLREGGVIQGERS